MYCDKCGAKLRPGTKFCAYCGGSTEQMQKEQQDAQNEFQGKDIKKEKVRQKKTVGIILCIALIAGVAFGVINVILGSDELSEKSTSKNTESKVKLHEEGGSEKPEEAAEAYVQTFAECDYELADVYSAVDFEKIDKSLFIGVQEDNEYGENYKTYVEKLGNPEECSEREIKKELKSLKNRIKSVVDDVEEAIPSNEIERMCYMDGMRSVGHDFEFMEEEIRIYCVKIESKWYVLDTNDSMDPLNRIRKDRSIY